MDHADSLLEGLDVAEDVQTPEAPEQPKEPTPEAKAPEKQPEEGKAPAEEPKPEAKEPEKAEKPKDERKSIPLAAHLEEKRRWESKANEFEQNYKSLKAEIEALKNPPKPPAPEPDFTQDPRGYVDHKIDHKIGAALSQLETGTKSAKQTAEQAAAAAEETRFLQALNTNEQAFVAQNPDYFAALDHLRQLRASELVMLNPDLNQQQVGNFIVQEELQLAANILRSGRNPSEVAYQIAKSRGYTKKQPASAEVPVLPNVPKPKQLAPDQTLGTGAGSPSAGEQFMDDDEVFDKAFNEVFGRKRA